MNESDLYNVYQSPNGYDGYIGFGGDDMDRLSAYGFFAGVGDNRPYGYANPFQPSYGEASWHRNIGGLVDNIADFGESLQTPQGRSAVINNVARPALQVGLSGLLGSVGGVAASPTILGVPGGYMLGGAVGNSAANGIADAADYFFGVKPPEKGLLESLNKEFRDGALDMSVGALPYPIAKGLGKVITDKNVTAVKDMFNKYMPLLQDAPKMSAGKISYKVAPHMSDKNIIANLPKLLDKTTPYLKVSHVTNSSAKKILEKTGIDLKGYNITFTSSDTQHMFRQHGDGNLYERNPKRPVQNKEIFTTLEDVPLIVKAPNSFDDVYESAEKGKFGETILVFTKEMPSGFVHIMTVGMRRGNLVPKTSFALGRKGMKREEILKALQRYKEQNIKK